MHVTSGQRSQGSQRETRAPSVRVAEGDEWSWETLPAEGQLGGRRSHGLWGIQTKSSNKPVSLLLVVPRGQACALREASPPWLGCVGTQGSELFLPAIQTSGCCSPLLHGWTRFPCLPRLCETHFISSGSAGLACCPAWLELGGLLRLYWTSQLSCLSSPPQQN